MESVRDRRRGSHAEPLFFAASFWPVLWRRPLLRLLPARPSLARAMTAVGAFSSPPTAGRASALIAMALQSATATFFTRAADRSTWRAGSPATGRSGSASWLANNGPTAPVVCSATTAADTGAAKGRPAPAQADGKRNGANRQALWWGRSTGRRPVARGNLLRGKEAPGSTQQHKPLHVEPPVGTLRRGPKL